MQYCLAVFASFAILPVHPDVRIVLLAFSALAATTPAFDEPSLESLLAQRQYF